MSLNDGDATGRLVEIRALARHESVECLVDVSPRRAAQQWDGGGVDCGRPGLTTDQVASEPDASGPTELSTGKHADVKQLSQNAMLVRWPDGIEMTTSISEDVVRSHSQQRSATDRGWREVPSSERMAMLCLTKCVVSACSVQVARHRISADGQRTTPPEDTKVQP